jgi:hypothetical protein
VIISVVYLLARCGIRPAGGPRPRGPLDTELAANGAILAIRLSEWPLGVPGRDLLHARISKAIDAAVTVGSDQVIAMPELGEGVTGVYRALAADPRNRQDLHPAPWKPRGQPKPV